MIGYSQPSPRFIEKTTGVSRGETLSLDRGQDRRTVHLGRQPNAHAP